MKTLTTILLLAGLAAADPLPPQAQTLKDAGIRPDDAGLREYLKSLSPSPEVRREIAALISQLGSESRSREAAGSPPITGATPVATTRGDSESGRGSPG
jgi:hypothetical protein